MNLAERINEDMKAAMRAKDSARLDAIRMLRAAIKQKEVDGRTALDDAGIVAVIDKLAKQRRDSIETLRVLIELTRVENDFSGDVTFEENGKTTTKPTILRRK